MSVKQGSVMEGIFAMYCAGLLIDPNHGKSHDDIKTFIDALRLDTTLGKLETDNSLSVDYFNTFPTDNKQGPARKFKGVTVVNGTKAKQMITASPTKSNEIKKEIKNSDNYFETLNIDRIQDFSQVKLKVRVKEAETGALYGSNLSKLNKIIDDEIEKTKKLKKRLTGNVKNYVDIKNKMLTLIKSKHTTFFKTLTTKKINFIQNSQSDVVVWTVDADGIAGETSGGEIKQDVTIDITANGKKLVHETLNFSLKSDSVSIHGGGIYNSMPEIFEMFEGIIPSDRVKEGKKYLKSITTQKGHEESSKDAINSVWRLVGNGIPKSHDTSLSDHLWGILEKRLFGSSNAYKGKMQLLEMNQDELREITQKQFKRLRNSGVKLYPKWFPNDNPTQATPGSIKVLPVYPGPKGYVEKDKDMDMFKIRVSYLWKKIDGVRLKGHEGGKSEPAKVFIELGGKKSIVHDENWDDFFEKELVE